MSKTKSASFYRLIVAIVLFVICLVLMYVLPVIFDKLHESAGAILFFFVLFLFLDIIIETTNLIINKRIQNKSNKAADKNNTDN